MQDRFRDGYAALTEKEKEALRLIVRGHDAKSTAQYLGLSVHTINERLRDARRKLVVSSSKEAARLVLQREAGDPDFIADKQIGEAAPHEDITHEPRPEGPRRTVRLAWIGMGVVIMSLALGLLALIALPQGRSAPDADAASVEAASSDVTISARAWLALVDQGRWDESWAATSASFRKMNTAKVWASVSQQVRVPLGSVRSRIFLSQESVPAPPAGVEVIKFRTSFAAKPNALETVSLAREDGQWRVVGIYIE